MMNIGELIGKGSASIEADEDMTFEMEVTALWDAIVESVRYD